ncbi:MAG: hypothetical protein A2509_03715 [Candidatus Edwardsbacteria bacterium RIFOXYD12_FULL_50_11]|uniref:Uncharacterized protein n=1 Tax=Candidatus Edwardsbacteria bacterium GWF2_54_11 TaxID=1817851 RepID=A0A1F5R8W0_9BACT|nr:MAG: hypothetical protein A2502_03625 [Candidatus Edwardsbacteria bacterium RifOxyC12_full_54_24]OGF07803.1 MAG: hypothetical protein A2273_04875 [Candidatus Edwardsbacteria bacterium RifOxyA12_full_54_48]OGF10052.1 MAG: hypothetical protein A3K15_11290 [Candidatus Edwardsbacteria bacterium GWE2_54_12]OGF10481.1 MAG: hypothetical protein A2024_09025 [Candidatus Edwardsbacteria bacterium GWF2_54_11]OGF14964.1 MAG: hypothetical protein A2509_03715 [Candidatus Edwardsbacteria bacterium RIFOXYD1
MKPLEIKGIAGKIIGIYKSVFAKKWKEVGMYAENEALKYANNIAQIDLWKKSGQVTEEQARALMSLHARSMKMVLTSTAGMSLVLVEKAVNQAIDEIKGVVNKIIGWKLL